MKYTILTMDDPTRDKLRRKIRTAMDGFEEVKTVVVNGYTNDLDNTIDAYGFDINFDEWRPGEGGVWYSNINAWKYCAEDGEDLMVFEDDAIILPRFKHAINNIELPPDFDFVTFYIPYVHEGTIMPVRLVPTYQEHGMVCMLYSSQGAKKMLDILEAEGLQWPVDIWIFKKALAGELNGYSPAQFSHRLISHDFKVPTGIHEGERIPVHQPRKI